MPSAPWLAAGRLSSGGSENHRCTGACVKRAQTGIEIAAQRLHIQARIMCAHHRGAPQARCSDNAAGGQCIQRKVAVTDKRVARVGALWDGRQLKASRQNGGHILERMYSQIGAAVGKRLFKFLDEQTLASDL